MGYFNPICIATVFVLTWFAMFDSRELTKEQLKMLEKNMETWESAPKLERICEANVFRKKNTTTFNFKFDSPNGAVCDAVLKIKVHKKGQNATMHKFQCTLVPEGDPDDEPDFD